MAFDLACPADLSVLRIEGADADVRWSEVVDHVGGVDKDGGGTEPVSTFVTEVVEDAVYKILKTVQFGDGANSLTFKSINEIVYFDDAQYFSIKSNATLELGVLSNGYGIDGSFWSVGPSATMVMTVTGQTPTFHLYGSRLHSRNQSIFIQSGTIVINKGQITFASSTNYLRCYSGITLLSIKDLYLEGGYRLWCDKTPTDFDDVHIHNSTKALLASVAVTLDSLLVTNASTQDVWITTANTITLKNPKFHPTRIQIDDAGGIVIEQYTCNIHVADKNGNNLSGVVVSCEDQNENEVFSALTDANGDIIEQMIDYKKWEGTEETLTEYSPHKFIFTKAGQRTTEIKNVTVDSPIVWKVEMSGANRALVGGAT